MDDSFDKESLTKLIESAYHIEDALFDIQVERAEAAHDAESEEFCLRKREFEENRQDVSIRFQKLADHLFKVGAFDSKEQARAIITIDPETRRDYLGPDGVVPDDGTLNPEDEVGGILALMRDQEYIFQVPIAYFVQGEPINIKFALPKLDALITSDFSSLKKIDVEGPFNIGLERSQGFREEKKWIWIEGKLIGKNFRRIKLIVETLSQEIQGGLLALKFAEFWNYHLIKPPSMLIGSGATFNTGTYVNSVAASVAFGIRFKPEFQPEGELDERLGAFAVGNRRSRLFERLFSSGKQQAREIRQALRMYLRAHAAWSEGEKAMLIATMLEGLLLDRRKDDLSARLQDAVAYWIGTDASNREEIRKDIKHLYSARSDFVHNGELAPKNFSDTAAFSYAQKVIIKEIENL